MEIKIELKPIDLKVFEKLEEVVSSKIKLLSEYEKMVLKHKIMDIKKNSDVVEFELKNLTESLNQIGVEPKEESKKIKEEKVVEKTKEEPEEIEL